MTCLVSLTENKMILWSHELTFVAMANGILIGNVVVSRNIAEKVRLSIPNLTAYVCHTRLETVDGLDARCLETVWRMAHREFFSKTFTDSIPAHAIFHADYPGDEIAKTDLDELFRPYEKGYQAIFDDSNYYRVKYISVDSLWQRKGIGTSLYTAAAMYVGKRGFVLCPGKFQSKEAKQWWDTARRRSVNKTVENGQICLSYKESR